MAGFARRPEKVQEQSEKLRGQKGKLYGVKCDVANHTDVEKAFKWVKDNLGPVHVLVNNAGTIRNATIVGTSFYKQSATCFVATFGVFRGRSKII